MDYEASIEIDDDIVKEYVRDTFTVDNVYSDIEILDYIHRDKGIEDVYSRIELESWAIENGYVKEE